MKEYEFVISRTSGWDNEQPHPKAKSRLVNLPDVKKGVLEWYMSFKTIQDILDFKKEVKNDLVITESMFTRKHSLEIYDGYH